MQDPDRPVDDDDGDRDDDWPDCSERTELEWLTEVTETWTTWVPTSKLRTLLGLPPGAPLTADVLTQGKDRLESLLSSHEKAGDAIEFDVGERTIIHRQQPEPAGLPYDDGNGPATANSESGA